MNTLKTNLSILYTVLTREQTCYNANFLFSFFQFSLEDPHGQSQKQLFFFLNFLSWAVSGRECACNVDFCPSLIQLTKKMGWTGSIYLYKKFVLFGLPVSRLNPDLCNFFLYFLRVIGRVQKKRVEPAQPDFWKKKGGAEPVEPDFGNHIELKRLNPRLKKWLLK